MIRKIFSQFLSHIRRNRALLLKSLHQLTDDMITVRCTSAISTDQKFAAISERYPQLVGCREAITETYQVLEESFRNAVDNAA